MQNEPLTRANLKTPKAAAIAGILFSVLLLAVFWLLRTSFPADPQEPGSWLRSSLGSVALALNLMPFAGIAFLWFLGVLRDRLGQQEDRFFATVFFGSGLLFLAMLFTAAKVSHLAKLPQGKVECARRVKNMVEAMDKEGFGGCGNHYECQAVCPKGIHVKNIAKMNREYLKSVFKSIK